jgi:hypothetical protein
MEHSSKNETVPSKSAQKGQPYHIHLLKKQIHITKCKFFAIKCENLEIPMQIPGLINIQNYNLQNHKSFNESRISLSSFSCLLKYNY